MDTTNLLSEKKLIEQMVTPEKMSPAFVAACECSSGEEQLNQEMEYLWDDCDSSGKVIRNIFGEDQQEPYR